MSHWALDLGTTNSVLARWDEERLRPEIVKLKGLSREVHGDDPLATAAVVPSAVHLVEQGDLWTVLGRWPTFSDKLQWGRHAYIGEAALARNTSASHPCFARGFKRYLQHSAHEPVARVGSRRFSAREVGVTFLRELFAEVERQHGERVRELTVTAPVDAYESYRAEVARMLRKVGVRKVHFVDEPVAAAAGYGLAAKGRRKVLVVDFGGGTLDLALVELDARSVGEGSCTVLAKAGRPLGGNLVDRWLLELCARRMEVRRPVDEDPFWYQLLLQEACALKESLLFRERESFYLRPPDAPAWSPGAGDPFVTISRADLEQLLEERGLYRAVRACTDELLAGGVPAPDDVVLVGGSTLLPGIFRIFEQRFGRDRVRGWKPFEAVGHGACALAASDFEPADFIVHDYGFELHDAGGGSSFTVVVPAGTRFPTRPDLWSRSLVPTCARGEPERIFKLVVAELGKAQEGEASFGWDAGGALHRLDQDAERLVVPLNASNPTLGTLDPPHRASDRNARLQISFGVDEDRWLIATVLDLQTGRALMKGTPVVRLL